MLTARKILKEIGQPKLTDLCNNGDGYWYFVYDDRANAIYDTRSIYTMRLSDMPLERWVAEGKQFVTDMEGTLAARNPPGTFKLIYKATEE